jgi:hypothetical protein
MSDVPAAPVWSFAEQVLRAGYVAAMLHMAEVRKREVGDRS